MRRAGALAVAALLLPAGCQAPAGPDYYPLAGGHQWRYRLTRVSGGVRHEQRLLVHNLGPARMADNGGAWSQWINGTIRYFRRREDGLYRLRRDGTAALFLPHPAAPPQSWRATIRSGLLTIRKKALEAPDSVLHLSLPIDYRIAASNETVTTPAGSFHHCLRVEGRGQRRIEGVKTDQPIHLAVHSRRWFCPGAGLVRSEREESSDSNFLNDGRREMALLSHRSP